MNNLKNMDLACKTQIEFTLNTIIKLLLIVILVIGIIVLYNFNNKIDEEPRYNNKPIKVQIDNSNEFSAE